MNRTTEQECPDCSGFHRCSYHEGVRHGRKAAQSEFIELLTDHAERRNRLMQSATEHDEILIEDGQVQACIMLYMQLEDVDWLTAEEVIHPETEPGDNDPYREEVTNGS